MEIKFRAKDTDSDRWLYGYYIFHQKTMLCLATDKEVEENEEHLLVFDGICDWNLPMPWYKADINPKTLGQYVNIRDINNKEVYVGDIVIDELSRDWLISNAPGGFVICRVKEYVLTGENPIIVTALSEPQCVAWFKENCKIVGNIYDNPELLSKKEEKDLDENQK